MIGREFVKHLRLLYGRRETITTRFGFNAKGQLVEHIVVQTYDRPAPTPSGMPHEVVNQSKDAGAT
jgi:hypothetical protein